jgi:hypothetical protein
LGIAPGSPTFWPISDRGGLAWIDGSAHRASELAAQVEVYAVGLFERLAECLDFGAVSFLNLGDLLGEGLDKGVVGIRWRRVDSGGSGIGP